MGQLQIMDSGPGLPSGFDVMNATSMGLRLVNMLVRQLRGRLKVENEHGASWTLSFPLEEPRKLKAGAAGASAHSDR